MSNEYDVIVIGGGPAGYPAAIRAAQNKLKVACIDEWKNKDGTAVFGGTCTNAGCIPSKALLESSELYHKTEGRARRSRHQGRAACSSTSRRCRNARPASSRPAPTASRCCSRARVSRALQGHGKLLAGRKVEFTAHDGKNETLTAQARRARVSGSVPTELKSMPFDGKNIVDSWGALDFETVPKKLAVSAPVSSASSSAACGAGSAPKSWCSKRSTRFLAIADQGLAKEAAAAFQETGPRHQARREGVGRQGRRRRRRSQLHRRLG